jgi:hypothetical protein
VNQDAHIAEPRRSGLWAAAAILVLGCAGAIMLSIELDRQPEAAAAPVRAQLPIDASIPIDAPLPIDAGMPIDAPAPPIDATPPQPTRRP